MMDGRTRPSEFQAEEETSIANFTFVGVDHTLVVRDLCAANHMHDDARGAAVDGISRTPGVVQSVY